MPSELDQRALEGVPSAWVDGWPRGVARASAALSWVAASPCAVWASMFLASALATPYAGIVHDASLYALQALNRSSGGQFADDLFLKYGSQDRYSLFSPIVAPVVQVLGVELSFLLLCLLSIGLLLEAVRRLVGALVDGPRLAVVAALFVAVAPMPYGGLSIFQVNEPFFTPRLFASATVIFAIERTLARRHTAAVAALLVGLVFHPVMALPGVAVWAVLAPWQRFGGRLVIPLFVAAAVAGLAGLAFAPAGLLGFIDADWRQVIRAAAPYNFVDEWSWADWATVVGQVTIVSAAALKCRLTRLPVSRLLAAVVAVGLGGLAATAIAAATGQALPFQAQPYRALWLVSVLHLPCGAWLIASLAHRPSFAAHLVAVTVALFLTLNVWAPVQIVMTPIAAAWLIGHAWIRRPPTRKDLLRALWRGLLIGVCASPLAAAALTAVRGQDLLDQRGPVSLVRTVVQSPGTLGLAFVVIAVLAGFAARTRTRPMLVAWCVGGAVVLQALAFWGAVFSERAFGLSHSLEAVRAHVAARANEGRPVQSVYSNTIGAGLIWREVNVQSYFHFDQAVGVMFDRRTAMEVRRRAALVAPFELDRVRPQTRSRLPRIVVLMTDRLFSQDSGRPSSANDLRRLCAEAEVDVVALGQEALPGPGRPPDAVTIHDCRDPAPSTGP